LENEGVAGRIILKCISKIYWKVVKWFDLNQDREKGQTVVNRVMNICV
jgi:hypothetical protein